MSDDFEIISRITDEIYDFIEEIGVEPTQYSYDYDFDSEKAKYNAVVKLISGSVDGVVDSFLEYRDEFSAHMAVSFPGIEVVLTVQVEDGVDLLDDDEDADRLLAAVVDGIDEDDISTDDIDSIERQYEDEGLYIIGEDDEDAFHTDEQVSDDDEDDDEGSIFDDAQTESEDDYRPSAEDMEDLWRTFGGDGDE